MSMAVKMNVLSGPFVEVTEHKTMHVNGKFISFKQYKDSVTPFWGIGAVFAFSSTAFDYNR